MPARPQSGVAIMATSFQKLGIVAGGGLLPKRLLKHCDEQDIKPFIVGFKGQTDEALLSGRDHTLMRLGEAGKIIRILREQNVTDLVLIGSIERPKARDLYPDLYTAAFFAKMGFKAMGDDSLLTAIRHELERQGFNIHGIHELIPELLTRLGPVGGHAPNADQILLIDRGMNAARKLGAADLGQSVVVDADGAITEENSKGTDHLIRKAAAHGAVLVKMCKPQQDRKLDLPTIGSNTVKLCAQTGYAGIAVEAGSSLIADEDEVRRLADAHGLFVVGI